LIAHGAVETMQTSGVVRAPQRGYDQMQESDTPPFPTFGDLVDPAVVQIAYDLRILTLRICLGLASCKFVILGKCCVHSDHRVESRRLTGTGREAMSA
jgi:hypothetical protein